MDNNLTNVVFNKKEILNLTLENIFLLFNRRGYTKDVPDSKLKEEFIENKVIYYENDSIKLSVIFIDSEIKNITTGSVVDDYLNKNVDFYKFILCKSFSKKVYKQVNEVYKNCEIFFNYEFMEDIPSKKFIPNHTLLNNEEKQELLQKFTLREISKIYITDMMARYYGAKVNDIFRIKRHNISSGSSIVYRVVIPGNLDILF
mgnify:CR=1 FL=1